MKKRPTEARIEPLEMKHAPFIQRYASDPAIAATTHVPHPLPENFGKESVRWAVRLRDEGSGSIYAVYNDETFVGLCGVRINEERPNLFYWIGKPFWGHGHGTAGAFAVLKRVFSEQGYPLIAARSLAANLASIRILEKCGFQYESSEEYEPGTLNWYVLKQDDFNRIVQTREMRR
ncbi:MAG: GNAT family N-acetyltransferase [Candidatus Poribacteria bacterium]|nr:GNAT family N-acetyltransferase [Candidatus Poribacteria bacterium]